MAGLFEEPDDATPLTTEERRELIPDYLAHRKELNAAEQENIERGQAWALRSRRDPLSDGFICELHRRMFGDVWRWAGQYRTSERTLGIAFYQIQPEVRRLQDDSKGWLELRSYPPDEIAVRLHHRLVYIHPFPNGNGRHARLMADLLIMSLGHPRFGWGSANLQSAGDARRAYIAALRAADRHDLGPLLEFARS